MLIHLPNLAGAETKMVTQGASVDQSFVFSSIPGLALTIYAGTTLTLPDGTTPNPFPLIAVQIPVDRLPDQMAMSTTSMNAFIVAFQPEGAVASRPIAVTFPNSANTPAGTTVALDTLDPTKGVMVQYGTAVVSADANQSRAPRCPPRAKVPRAVCHAPAVWNRRPMRKPTAAALSPIATIFSPFFRQSPTRVTDGCTLTEQQHPGAEHDGRDENATRRVARLLGSAASASSNRSSQPESGILLGSMRARHGHRSLPAGIVGDGEIHSRLQFPGLL